MGLDMYFSAQKYIPGGYNHMKGTEKEKTFDSVLSAVGVPRGIAGSSVTVDIQIGYLRKANAIHSWLVQNIQDGKDECQTSYFSAEKVAELRANIRAILATVDKGEPVQEENFGYKYDTYPDLKLDKALAASLLEPAEGFFFGSQEYDEGYVDDLETADRFLTTMLEHPALKNADFYYHASW